ncbi:MAG: hypothetical protein IJH44_01525 [Solobacterium sp.]|nr:hypothetical protein [Solobacterium sp.]MBR0213388.1 hypothetical protein [Solobacterium sp.]
MKQSARILTYVSVLHNLVDFLCAFAVFSRYALTGPAALVYLYYNFAAFALQMPLGILADVISQKTGRRCLSGKIVLLAGVLFTAVGLQTSVWALGLGNALFHVGGGLLSIAADDQAGLSGRGLGIFVAPGAVGLYLGTRLGRGGLSAYTLPAVILMGILSAAVMLEKTTESAPVTRAPEQPGRIALLCFLIVVLRSWTGMNLSFQWNTGFMTGLVVSAAVALGKAAGGFPAARYGLTRSACATLLAATVLMPVPYMPAGLLVLFLFNMTMPMTLYRLYRAYPEQPGFAFGLLTFALFAGFVPWLAGLAVPAVTAGISGCAVSAALFVLMEKS